MIEYYTRGIVLDRKPRGEQDATIVLYTKELGKILAFSRSIRRIRSKLSGHFLPGNTVQMRVVIKNNIQAIDALGEKPKCDTKDVLKFINFIDQVIPYGEPDAFLWNTIHDIVKNCRFTPSIYSYLLGEFGFGLEYAVCGNCTSSKIAYFSLPDIMFLCSACSKLCNNNEDEIIEIKR